MTPWFARRSESSSKATRKNHADLCENHNAFQAAKKLRSRQGHRSSTEPGSSSRRLRLRAIPTPTESSFTHFMLLKPEALDTILVPLHPIAPTIENKTLSPKSDAVQFPICFQTIFTFLSAEGINI